MVGNRPQFVKAAALASPLAERCDHLLVHTGQHYDQELSDVFFAELGLPRPDHTIETGSGSHAQQTAAIMTGLEPLLHELRPDLVVIYGDTNSTLAAALVAAKATVRLAHVEAGLRSFDRTMPEEVNRVVADALSDLRLCPSETAVANLAREGMTAGVHQVGDVMVDVARVFGPIAVEGSRILERLGITAGGYGLLTVHRPVNTAAEALPRLVEVLEAVPAPLAFPVHPRTRAALERARLLERAASAAILTEPLGYLDFTALLAGASVCLTDSGGVQKEAYLHRVPCLTLRDTSEWVETIDTGWNRLVALRGDAVAGALRTLSRPQQHPDLYGDGHAAERIAAIVTGRS